MVTPIIPAFERGMAAPHPRTLAQHVGMWAQPGRSGRAKARAAATALEVKRLEAPGLHAVGTVPGLCLRVMPPPSSTKMWTLRIVVGTKRRDLGLGGYPAVTLAKALEVAREKRHASGEQRQDPVNSSSGVRTRSRHRSATRSPASLVSQQKQITFAQAAAAYIAAHEAGWKNAKHAWQWNNSLELYAFPKVGQLDVGDIGMVDVLEVLEPIWRTKTETASRIRGRIELILAWADKRAERERLNPARWHGHLDTQLPGTLEGREVPRHHPALPVSSALPRFHAKALACASRGDRRRVHSSSPSSLRRDPARCALRRGPRSTSDREPGSCPRRE